MDLVYLRDYFSSINSRSIVGDKIDFRIIYHHIPHIDYFTQNIHSLKHESAVRPTAKICKWIAEAYVKKHKTTFVTHIKPIHIERIVETGFDWMITETKVATKAYSMDTLYYFGCLNIENFEWIHQELKNIVLQNSSKESSAYKAHARQILHSLK